MPASLTRPRGRPRLVPQATVAERYENGNVRLWRVGPHTYTRWGYRKLVLRLREAHVL